MSGLESGDLFLAPLHPFVVVLYILSCLFDLSHMSLSRRFLFCTYEYPTKVPNTQIRFRWTSCRGTMHQTLITDRGRPKNRYPYNLSVPVSYIKPVNLNIIFSSILQPFNVSSVDCHITRFDIFAVSPTDIPTDTNRYPKTMTNLSGKPSGHNNFGLTHENPYVQPFLWR